MIFESYFSEKPPYLAAGRVRLVKKPFDKLKQYNISIPVVNYKTDIINLRNSVVHKGIDVSERETRDYLIKCRTIIDEYEPSIIGNDLI